MASLPADWIEHRRGDGERLGWMRPDDDGFVVVDLLGRERTPALEWLDAEEFLDGLGIGYLADVYELDRSGERVRVRLTEVSPRGIRAKLDDFGDITRDPVWFDLPWPAPEALVPRPGRAAPAAP